MEAAQMIGEGLTFEKVWAAIQATTEQMKETDRILKETDRIVKENAEQMKETDRQMKETDRIVKENAEQMKETDRQMKETDRQMKETDRRMKETDKRVGAITNRFGEMVEYMVIPNLVVKFDKLGLTFTKATRTIRANLEHAILTEVDAFLENGEKVMAVEIKTKPNIEDINDHVLRMEKLRVYADLHKDKRKYMGAMAGVVFNDSEKTYALKKGFYVIEPSGETFNITEPTGRYHLSVW